MPILIPRTAPKTVLRSSVICKFDNRQVFQIVKPFRSVSLADVQDCIYASGNMKPDDVHTYMYSHGIDMDRVSKYFDIVQKLEKSMKAKTSSGY